MSRAVASVGLLLPTLALGADVIETHPNAAQLKAAFAAPVPADFRPTGVTRADYLKLIAANVDHFRTCQDAAGAIIDPVSHGERQYSTPAYAAAAGLLVSRAGRADLVDSASRAMTFALTALVQQRPADRHADFYTPLLMHAYRSLRPVVPPAQANAWAALLKQIDPETMYRADLRAMNWNIVSTCGELLRRKDGLVAPEMAGRQAAYLESSLAGHLGAFTAIGLCEDPGAPMAYDGFSRLWLEDVYADDAYDGPNAGRIGDFLRTGGLSTLLMLSPAGEWPTGGRSGLHNWTDAQAVAICEMNATYWQRRGRADVAGAFKRAAHLAFQSVARWQRPSGELNIVKNRADPAARLAYESYSNHSQYNLLPMAMLAIAAERADDTIAERPCPSETGGYVFDARERFHKVIAVAGGYYAEIDTAADGHYNATGLQRVQRAGVPFSALSDTVAPQRAYGPDDAPKAAVAVGLQWQTAAGGPWIGLADFLGGREGRTVAGVDLSVSACTPARTEFTLKYTLAGDGGAGRVVTEAYVLTADGVTQTSAVSGDTAALRLQWPVLVHDGAADTQQAVMADGLTITHGGAVTHIGFAPGRLAGPITVGGPRLINHNGYVQTGTAEVKPRTAVTVTIDLRPAR